VDLHTHTGRALFHPVRDGIEELPGRASYQRPCDLVGSVDEELRDRLNVQFFEATRPTGDGALPYSR